MLNFAFVCQDRTATAKADLRKTIDIKSTEM